MRISRIGFIVFGSLQLACSSTEPKVVEEGGVRVVHVQGEWLRKLPQARSWLEVTYDSLSGDSTPRSITGGILLANGNAVVSNDATQTLEIYDASGRLTARLGGKGSGPKEYRSVHLLHSANSNEIVVADPVRQELIVTDSAGTIIDRTRLSPRRQPLFRFPDRSELRRIRSRLPDATTEGIVRTTDQLVRESGEMRLGDLGYHPSDDFVLRQGSNGLTGGEVPLGRRLLADARAALVVVAPTGTYEIYLYEPSGRLSTRISVQRDPIRIADSFRSRFRDSVLALYGRDEYGKREWSLLTAPDVFPKELAQFDAIALSQNYELWVRDGSLPDSVANWTVFDRTGVPVFRAVLPGALRVLDVAPSAILGVLVDHDGLEKLVKMRFEKPSVSLAESK